MHEIIIDSDLSLEAALTGSVAPLEIMQTLQVLAVPYFGFDACWHRGQIVIARELVAEVTEIFAELCDLSFPIQQVVPVCQFGWSDDESMNANNSSGFNYRAIVGGSGLSCHALGRAIDINPRQNPFIKPSPDGTDLVLPAGAVYDPQQTGTLSKDSEAVRIFESRGWEWGGRWTTRFDYHHFQKPE